MPFGTERDTRTAIDSRLVECVFSDHLIRRNGNRIKPEERVKSSEKRSCRLGELLAALVQAAAADKIHIHRSPRICVDHGVERQRPLPDIPRRKSQRLNGGSVDVELIVLELK